MYDRFLSVKAVWVAFVVQLQCSFKMHCASQSGVHSRCTSGLHKASAQDEMCFRQCHGQLSLLCPVLASLLWVTSGAIAAAAEFELCILPFCEESVAPSALSGFYMPSSKHVALHISAALLVDMYPTPFSKSFKPSGCTCAAVEHTISPVLGRMKCCLIHRIQGSKIPHMCTKDIHHVSWPRPRSGDACC